MQFINLNVYYTCSKKATKYLKLSISILHSGSNNTSITIFFVPIGVLKTQPSTKHAGKS